MSEWFDEPAAVAVKPAEEPATDPKEGHTYTFTVVQNDFPLVTQYVHAWSLREALLKLVELPLGEWFEDDEEEKGEHCG